MWPRLSPAARSSRWKLRRRGSVRPVDMAEVPAGIDPVADQLLQLLDVGEAAIALALPDQRAVEMDFEDAAGPGHEGHFAHFERKGRKHLLSHPGRSQQPVALRAVDDPEAGLAAHSAGSPRLERKLCGSTIVSSSARPRASCVVVSLTR